MINELEEKSDSEHLPCFEFEGVLLHVISYLTLMLPLNLVKK